MIFDQLLGRRPRSPLWDDAAPLRAELFSVDRLEVHARSLAAAQIIRPGTHKGHALTRRLQDNAAYLLTASQTIERMAMRKRQVSPAAEWLIDNYHLVDMQVREIGVDLPPGYYLQLPKLLSGPFADLPRVFGLAWSLVAHTDSHFEPETLHRYLAAYQEVQPLTIGELWAVPITMRIVLIENLRRLASTIVANAVSRQTADTLADRLMRDDSATPDISADSVTDAFAVQFAQRLRGHDPREDPALGWLDRQLAARGTTTDEVVHQELQRQGTSNATVRNIITSLRAIAGTDWTEAFEQVSQVDAILGEATGGSQGGFRAMDFPTRNAYRTAIETLARGCKHSEPEIARAAVAEARAAPPGGDPRLHDPGYYFMTEGRRALEADLAFRPALQTRLGRACRASGVASYGGAVVLLAVAFAALATGVLAWLGVQGWPLVGMAVLGIIPVSDAVVACINRGAMWAFGATVLPGLELADGIPPSMRTLVAVPIMLTSPASVAEQVARLEIHHLSSPDGELHYALLSDWADSQTEHAESDVALLAVATDGIARLNRQYGPAPGGARFLLLHRRRVWSSSEACWLGWERKRGKLHELNRALRGANDTNFIVTDQVLPTGIRFVVTLDADTRLPRDAVRRLVGKMAHPLNLPRVDAASGRVVEGYAVLQPRVTPSLPVGQDSTLFQRIFSSMDGIDPYAGAVSDVYQDLFGEGSFAGKGIYDVDAFEAALAGRVPESSLLSHDLLEGVFARAGLASDIEVVEEFPTGYVGAYLRQHRWARGDWQLLPWIVPWIEGYDRGGLPAIGRWKMLDNLRRTLSAPACVVALLAGWLLPFGPAAFWTAFVVGSIALPALLPVLGDLVPGRRWVSVRSYLETFGTGLRHAVTLAALIIVFLAHQAVLMSDAIVRTLVRVILTRRHLLEWVTAAQVADGPRPGLAQTYRLMAGAPVLALVAAMVGLWSGSWAGLLVVPFVVAWSASPAVALWISRCSAVPRRLQVTADDRTALRLAARRTWRFFETFVTPADNMLPPDNFQEDPVPILAHRTSPTNIGLYLLSTISAHDFGWVGLADTVDRLEATLATMQRLQRFRGHFYNWYDTVDLRPLEPRYISTVDSGNLAGHLIAMAGALREWRDGAAVAPGRPDDAGQLATIDRANGGSDPFWAEAVQRTAASYQRDAGCELHVRLIALEHQVRTMALAMEFGFLRNPDRKLLSIGFLVSEDVIDTNCYDLLASEARLAVFVAIAKGDVPAREWFRLGRAVIPAMHGAALVSWSGSMFEYLMPSLVMRAPGSSLLEQTNRMIVERQVAFGQEQGIPWGVSESAYNVRDIEYTYQYSNFGIPGLGLKRGLDADRVIAPYATALAAMVDPQSAVRNFGRLAAAGALGRYGFYEALDYTPARVQEGADVAIVRAYMAHHQGMTIVAAADAVMGGIMRKRFHAEPLIQATELLLQERAPRTVAVARPLLVGGDRPPPGHDADLPSTAAGGRRFDTPHGSSPATHLLSNGRYTVMITAAGSGYSRCGDQAVTRWREDATLDDWGSYIALRDVKTGRTWSAGFQPIGVEPDEYEVAFREDRAEFARRDGTLTTMMDVLVSPEVDAEARRVTITNAGPRPCEIDVSSYAELALVAQATDVAHPAFAKLFVETEYLPALQAILATRRRRTPDDPEIWAAHSVVVENAASVTFETDRARFLGRGRSVREAVALDAGGTLSGTAGTVLDAIISLRQRVTVPAGGMARVTFWTMVAPTRAELLACIDKHRDAAAFDRASTLAWTMGQVQLHHLGISAPDADLFQRLAGHLIFAGPALRPPSSIILHGAGPQSGLWPYSISGDLPILLLRINDNTDLDVARELLLAHEYWRLKRLAVDLVILNEHAASYSQDLQNGIEALLRTQRSGPADGLGAVKLLRADLMPAETCALLVAVARVVLRGDRGGLAEQLDRLREPAVRAPVPPVVRRHTPTAAPDLPEIELSNGLGGFAHEGREYVIALGPGQTTPAPWVNVIANPGFGFLAAAEGSGATWSHNSRENQVTPWSNDPVTNRPGEAFYLQDADTLDTWCLTAAPDRDPRATYVATHGWGWTRYERTAFGIAGSMAQFVPVADPIKITRLHLHNTTDRTRRIAVTAFVEWVLGPSRPATAAFVATSIDPGTDGLAGPMLARNAWTDMFGASVAFCDMAGRQSSWTGDRSTFIGRNSSLNHPAAIAAGGPLTGGVGAGFDPCGAMRTLIELPPDGRGEVVFLLGQATDADHARALVDRYRQADLDKVLEAVSVQWDTVLGAITVTTPDRSMDIMLNGWLMYQTLACRVWARAGFYQASGAYGFRDQLQDGMALVASSPALVREHLLRAASRQFTEGDVQHWWLPESGRGVRTRISDDCAWLATTVAHYVDATGDTAVLDEVVSYLTAPLLAKGEHDRFGLPEPSGEEASLFEHCAVALDHSLAVGVHGLPLMGTGDWNDGMSRVGQAGRGESVWLGWFLHAALTDFIPLAEARQDVARVERWRAHTAALASALDRAWDGEWYVRAYFDDGTPLGSRNNMECRIDAIAQSWAVLGGVTNPARAACAMASVRQHLIRDGLVLVLAPPFDRMAEDPGYIKGYPPGIRENGGQYTHAALWTVMAVAALGDGTEAARLFALLNPINHTRTPADIARYKLEPYAVAADIYSMPPHIGRGGWSWYTGSAGWMQRTGVESILGICIRGETLHIDPCIPAAWPGYSAIIKWRSASYDITVQNPAGVSRGVASVKLDGAPLDQRSPIPLVDDGALHRVTLVLGH